MGKNLILTSVIIVACFAAAFGGYKGARYIADSITLEAEENAERAGLFRPPDMSGDIGEDSDSNTNKNSFFRGNPASIVYIVNYETGKIENIMLEYFDTIRQRFSLLYIEPDISYTMTGELYRKLVAGNVLLPQTVTLKELYGYYGNDAAFTAGEKIIGEFLGIGIGAYISLEGEDGIPDFRENGSTVSEICELFKDREGRITDLVQESEEKCIEFLESLRDIDIYIYETPVIRRNESCFADMTGLWEILAGIMPETGEES